MVAPPVIIPSPIVYAGQELIVTWNLTNAAGVLTDPTALTVKYQDAGLVNAVTTVLIGALTHVGPGNYTLLIDTTNMTADVWNIQAVATGAVLSTDVQQFQILARPLG